MDWEYIIAIIGAALLIVAVVWALYDRHAGRIEALEAELDAERYQAAGVRRECDKRTLAIERLRAQQGKTAARTEALQAEIKRLTEREAELTDATDAHSKRIDSLVRDLRLTDDHIEVVRLQIQAQIDEVKEGVSAYALEAKADAKAAAFKGQTAADEVKAEIYERIDKKGEANGGAFAMLHKDIADLETESNRKIDDLKTDIAHQGERLSDMDEVTVALQGHEHDAVSAQAELIRRLTAQVGNVKFTAATAEKFADDMLRRVDGFDKALAHERARIDEREAVIAAIEEWRVAQDEAALSALVARVYALEQADPLEARNQAIADAYAKGGTSYSKVARDFDVSRRTVQRIVTQE